MAEINKGRAVWNFLLNLKIVKWFLNLPISKKVGNSKIGQKVFCYETVSYLFFGVMTTIVSVATYWFFDLLIGQGVKINFFGEQKSLGYLISNTISFIFAITFAYVTNKLFVFESRNLKPSALLKEMALFAVARLTSFGIETLWMFVTVTLCGMNDFISKLIAQVIVVVANYIFSKIMVFKKPKNKGELQ